MTGGEITGNNQIVTSYLYNRTHGGGVFNAGDFVFSGGKIAGNKANGGGGVYNTGTFTMQSGAVISGNNAQSNPVAGDYGGAGVFTTGAGSYFTMEGGSIENNRILTSSYGGHYGGGIYIGSGSTFEMQSGEITGNTSINEGAAIYLHKNAQDVVMYTGTITGNISTKSESVVFIGEGRTFTMESGTISNNTGTGVYSNGTFIMKTGKINNNTYIGVRNYTDGVFEMLDGEINDNGYYGVNTAGSFTMEDGLITDNSAERYGGGVGSYGGDLYLLGGTISDNDSAYKGGGVFIWRSGHLQVEDTVITGNTATEYGGGIHAEEDATVTVLNSTISGNEAKKDGGGIYIDDLENLNTSGVTFSGNKAQRFYDLPKADALALHLTKILGSISFTDGKTYGYNNLDIFYVPTYTVTYDSDGGSRTPDPVTVDGKSKLIQPTNVTKEGHDLVGWYVNGGSQKWDFATDEVLDDFTLKAKWVQQERTVTFDPNNGVMNDADKIQTVLYGDMAVKPTNPTRTGYTFQHWAQGNTTTEFNFATEIKSNITLRAQWKINSYTVTFLPNGGTMASGADTQSVNYDAKVTQPAISKEGSELDGWYIQGTNTKWDFNQNRLGAANMTLEARWKTATYTVKFETGGGTPVADLTSVPYGTTITEPTGVTKTGYTLVEWYDKATGNTWNFSTSEVKKDVTLVARWKIDTYTVTFDSVGGTPVGAQQIFYQGVVTKPTGVTKTGYTLVEWYNKDTGNTWDFATDKVEGNMTLAARWEISTYTVKFETDGGTPVADLTGVQHETTISRPTDVTKSGYTLVEWYDKATGNTWNFSTDKVEGNMTLVARWKIDTYTVTFNSDGGTPVDAQQIFYQGVVTRPTGVTKTGHTLDGWYIEGTTTQWNFADSKVEGDMVLKAKWTPVSYQLIYDRNGGTGSIPAPRTYPYGTYAEVNMTRTPTKENREFVGWSVNKDADVGDTFPGGKILMTGNTTLYAIYDYGTYDVRYDLNGGDGTTPDTSSYNFEEEVYVAEQGDIYRTGYLFAGWSKNADGTGTIYRPNPDKYSFKMPSRPITLYAVWRPENGYPITVEHYKYEEGALDQAELADTESVSVGHGESYQATPKTYAGYLYMPSVSQASVTDVTGECTLKLYYMKADGYHIIYGEMVQDGKTTLEVLDRRLPDAVPMSWEAFVARIQPKLYLDGQEVTDATITFTSPNYDGINFRELTRGQSHQVEILASWNNGQGAVDGQLLLDIVDTTPPEITVERDRLEFGWNQRVSGMGDLLAMAVPIVSDNYDAEMAFKAYLVGTTFEEIDWKKPYEYLMYIEATDSSGNEAQRKVIVITVAGGDDSGGNSGGSGSGGNSSGGSDREDNHDRGGVVIDENGVPLGFYQQDENGNWVFINNEDVPLGTLPKTGATRHLLPALVCMAAATGAMALSKKRTVE